MIKNNQIISIFNDFYRWICDIEEDTPIPFETKNVYFLVEFSQNDIVLSYSADEKLFDIFDYGMFSPIDSQYFCSNELKKISKQIFDLKKTYLKNEIYSILKDIVFLATKKANFFFNYNIFYAKRFFINKLYLCN